MAKEFVYDVERVRSTFEALNDTLASLRKVTARLREVARDLPTGDRTSTLAAERLRELADSEEHQMSMLTAERDGRALFVVRRAAPHQRAELETLFADLGVDVTYDTTVDEIADRSAR